MAKVSFILHLYQSANMQRFLIAGALLLPVALLPSPVARRLSPVAPDPTLKKEAIASIDRRGAEMAKLSLQVWEFAETALRESHSSAVLADYAESQGFRVTRGVGGLPTAFTAEFGSGKPIIGIMGEYDALPGISNKALPEKTPLLAGAPGHGCGHNLFGVASLGAAAAIKDLIAAGKLKGTVRFYGTPAEESVGGKVYMAREGLFKDIDVMLVWHPAFDTEADVRSSQAIIDFIVEFKGKTAHAAGDPWNGRSAADGAEAFVHGVNLLREHVKPSVRMHYVIQEAGKVPNVVPDYAKVWMWVRDSKTDGAEQVLTRVRDIAEGAGKIAGVESKLTVQAGDYHILVNYAGARLLHRNMSALPRITYTEDEQLFARAVQKAAGVPEKGMVDSLNALKPPGLEPGGGSTDVGDVSWLVPTLHFSLTTAPFGVPWHAWPVVASSGHTIGQKGMMQAARVIATTAIDLFQDATTRDAIVSEFRKSTEGFVYKPYIPAGPAPIPAPR
jgi:aminobenzoyl-glutamate utilization protein B